MNLPGTNLASSAIVTLAILALLVSCKTRTPKDLLQESIIPVPVSVTATGSSFALTKKTGIYVQDSVADLTKTGQYLAGMLAPATGFELPVKSAAKTPRSNAIYLTTAADDAELGEQGYELTITENLIALAANAPAGVFNGIQTLRQLLPASIESDSVQQGPWEIATGTIRDYPGYSFRGVMLDVSRHFFGVDEVKRYIGLAAAYKINVLHLHLSDDQGWRIEIKSWPNLTAHGGSTEVGGTEGGFYTQEQYKDLVQYAADRQMTVIPEIDMPGHTNAALASYAGLNCNDKAPDLYTGTDVGFSTLCTSREITYKFIGNVVSELAAITPGPYIHIGGDESHVTAMKDYIPFINVVQDIVKTHGKQMIGWDEISNATLKRGTIAQVWASVENAKRAADQGVKLILSPANKCYLDMQYDSTTRWGLHWAAYIEVDSAYIWDPATLIPGVSKESILGIESPLWTETVTNMDELEYMVFPRLTGHAEIGWSPAPARNWDTYKLRLAKHGERLAAMGVNFYRSSLVPWDGGEVTDEQ
jgi:hexosaminidase